jgi:transcriptional regulator with XRE-family HTH domain
MALPELEETPKICRIIGENFRILREKKSLTFSQLEVPTGMHRPHLSRIERGTLNIRVSTLEVLAAALDVPAHALLIDGYAARLFK